jgi:hypothetical protein
MKRNASPGPNGFNVEFYLATWDWIGDDVQHIVQNFFHTVVLPEHAKMILTLLLFLKSCSLKFLMITDLSAFAMSFTKSSQSTLQTDLNLISLIIFTHLNKLL